uniref:Uncharacterized protein n=1 Tax=Panagrolaimus sp. PS1159 TaxID=55785 RepID=A0AC35FL38_9BILA
MPHGLVFFFLLNIFVSNIYGFQNDSITDECTSKYKIIIKDTCKTKHNSTFLCFNFNTTNQYLNSTLTEIIDSLSLQCCEDACTLDTIISKYCCDEEACFKVCREKIKNIRKRKPPLFRQILSSFMI